jgi:hypothetical protein
MPVELKSRIPEIVVSADRKGKENVSRTCLEIDASAKRNLIAHNSVISGNLVGGMEAHVEDFEGDVGTAVVYAPYVEYGTGRRGAASDFPGKPDDLTYSVEGRWESRAYSVGDLDGGGTYSERFFNEHWEGAAAKPYLIPAAEEARMAYERRSGEMYR